MGKKNKLKRLSMADWEEAIWPTRMITDTKKCGTIWNVWHDAILYSEDEAEDDFETIDVDQQPARSLTKIDTNPTKSKNTLSDYEIAKILAEQCIFGRMGEQLYKYDEQLGYFKNLIGITLYQEIKMPFSDDIRARLSSNSVREIKNHLLSFSEFHMLLSEFRPERERYVNFKNGVLDLKKMRVNAHSKSHQFLSVIDAEYRPESGCELSKTVKEYFETTCGGDQCLLRRIQIMFGLAISNIRSAKVGFFIIGKANTGKSTLIALLRKIVGEDNVSTLSLNDFTKNFRIERACGKLINAVSELSQEELKNIDVLKTVIGNRVDKITAERKFEPAFDFIPNFLPIFGGNTLPKIPSGKDPDHALRKRMYIINLTAAIPPRKQKKNILEKVFEKKDEIVAWAVAGIRDYLENGLPENEVGYDDLVNYESEDGLADFVSEFCVLQEGAWTATKSLLEAYREFCDDNQIADVNRASANRLAGFLKTMEGVEKSKRQNCKERQGHGYWGLAMKESC